MKTIVVTTQTEMDALPRAFDEYTVIEIRGGTPYDRISVEARENSSVVAWGSSSVEARGSSSVEARENSSVEAWGSSSVEAWGSSSVVAMENSSVVAWENSSVEARGSSSVVAWGSSSVEALESSSVVAWGNVAVRIHGDGLVLLYAFAVAWVFGPTKPKKKSKTCTVIHPIKIATTDEWVLNEVAEHTSSHVVVFKRVGADWKTREGTANETAWTPGGAIKHPVYRPKVAECGANKFHACSRPYFCDEFRSTRGDKYVAIRVPRKSLHYWGANASYPHKVAFGEGVVLYECDRMGREINKAKSTNP